MAVDEISANAEKGFTTTLPSEVELSELCDEPFESCLSELSVISLSLLIRN